MQSLNVLEDIMLFDDHRDSEKPNSISVTTLLGPMYKAKLYLAKTDKYETKELTYKRSSFIGTAFHERAAFITKDLDNYIVEQFIERQITVDGIEYTVAGSFDGLKKVDGKWYIYDFKTAYGKVRSAEALAKDAMQMSLYRWILSKTQPDVVIEDTGFTIFVSQSNNVMKEIPVSLMDLDQVTDYVESKLWAISNNEKVDCKDGVKYNACTYCDYNCKYRS